jgi:hypothetical protein
MHGEYGPTGEQNSNFAYLKFFGSLPAGPYDSTDVMKDGDWPLPARNDAQST